MESVEVVPTTEPQPEVEASNVDAEVAAFEPAPAPSAIEESNWWHDEVHSLVKQLRQAEEQHRNREEDLIQQLQAAQKRMALVDLDRREIDRLNTQLAAMTAERDLLRMSAKSDDKSLTDISALRHVYDVRVATLEQDVKNVVSEYQNLKQSLEFVSLEHETFVKEMRILTAENQACLKENATLRMRVSALASELVDARNAPRLSSVVSSEQILEFEAKRKDEEIATIRQQLRDTQQKLAEYSGVPVPSTPKKETFGWDSFAMPEDTIPVEESTPVQSPRRGEPSDFLVSEASRTPGNLSQEQLEVTEIRQPQEENVTASFAVTPLNRKVSMRSSPEDPIRTLYDVDAKQIAQMQAAYDRLFKKVSLLRETKLRLVEEVKELVNKKTDSMVRPRSPSKIPSASRIQSPGLFSPTSESPTMRRFSSSFMVPNLQLSPLSQSLFSAGAGVSGATQPQAPGSPTVQSSGTPEMEMAKLKAVKEEVNKLVKELRDERKRNEDLYKAMRDAKQQRLQVIEDYKKLKAEKRLVDDQYRLAREELRLKGPLLKDMQQDLSEARRVIMEQRQALAAANEEARARAEISNSSMKTATRRINELQMVREQLEANLEVANAQVAALKSPSSPNAQRRTSQARLKAKALLETLKSQSGGSSPLDRILKEEAELQELLSRRAETELVVPVNSTRTDVSTATERSPQGDVSDGGIDVVEVTEKHVDHPSQPASVQTPAEASTSSEEKQETAVAEEKEVAPVEEVKALRENIVEEKKEQEKKEEVNAQEEDLPRRPSVVELEAGPKGLIVKRMS